VDRFTSTMTSVDNIGDGVHKHQCDIRFEEVGQFGLNIRITPNHPNTESRHAMGLVIWGGDEKDQE